MNDICFNMENLGLRLNDCYESQARMRESLIGFTEVSHKAENEISRFLISGKQAEAVLRKEISEVEAFLFEIDRRMMIAVDKKRQETEIPPKPPAPSATKGEKALVSAYHEEVKKTEAENVRIREHNCEIDTYVVRCNEAKTQLASILSQLTELYYVLTKAVSMSVEQATELVNGTQDTIARETRVKAQTDLFVAAFERVHQAAENLYYTEPGDMDSRPGFDSRFRIRNFHAQETDGACIASYSSDAAGYHTMESEDVVCSSDGSDEILITTRDESLFFEAALPAHRIRMPSAALHKLGGRGFLDKMRSIGYVMIKQEDGTSIDINGMIHWEKTDV